MRWAQLKFAEINSMPCTQHLAGRLSSLNCDIKCYIKSRLLRTAEPHQMRSTGPGRTSSKLLRQQ